MRLRRASKAGFCFGVKRAIEMAGKTAMSRDGPVYSLGPIIHNEQVVTDLSRQGLINIESIDEAESGGTLIIRSHGVGPEVIEEARRKNITIVDATCPFVSRAQKIAAEMAAEGRQVIVIGDRSHPEVRGIVAWAGKGAMVVQDREETKFLPEIDKAAVLAQTTQTIKNFNEIVEELNSKSKDLTVINTICHATGERQQSAVELAGEVEVMVVVGGRNSANTAKLTALCRAAGTPAYQVETADDLQPEWFAGVKTAGVTAGASTPQRTIEEVETRMKELEQMSENEEGINEEGIKEESIVTEENKVQEPDAVETNEEETSQQGMNDAMDVKSVRTGEIVKGVVVQVGQDEVLVDVGAKSEGVIPLRELASFDVASPQELVKVGDEIEVYVLKAEDNEGRLILSKEKADAEKSWEQLQGYLESGEPVEGTVREVVKGGILVDVGVRAFLPASLVERGYVEDLNKYLGMTIKARVIELNRPRKKVILSRKVLMEEEFAQKRDEMMQNIQEGAVLRGTVRRLTSFGAFVDIGGIDGLLHISEMAWHRINHPSEVVSVGDEIEVAVLKVDRDSEKISLGLKQVLDNPWDNVEEKYPVGAIISAKVVRLAPFGAFVQLEPGVEGLVHISHLADHHVVKPDEVVQEGEEVKVKVLSVDKQEKRIRLSIREVNREREPRQPREFTQNKVQESGDGGNLTIGDLVGDIFDDKD
ncbi:MAG: 4-hydroxy-3-methylbut-2-enyl diphosphate reductase [Peptococcaceae bacterium BRH_c4b]|nr:MAG: 4-hydroxy-3-methylbut-2-enyl diphosphate reductase [Peptococcaceae bacterium BRH_c4b]